MLTKICLIVNYNLYESKRYFTRKLSEAMQRKGIDTRIVDVKESSLNADTISAIQRYKPDMTCSFNSLLPISENRFLWDFLQIPHWSILVDPAVYSLQYTKSPFSILSSVDRSDVINLNNSSFDKVFFWPHAVEQELTPDNSVRDLEVVFLGSCYDYESLRASWRQRNPEAINKVLDDAIDSVFSDNYLSLADSLSLSWQESKLNPAGVDFATLFYYLDNYTRGKDRVELIRSIKEAKVHVFGDLASDNAVGILGWKQYLASQKNVVVHPSVPFEEALQIQKRSKICLNSMPFFKNGSHERVLTTLACGAVPVTTNNLYFHEFFNEGEHLIYYSMKNRQSINDKINDLLKEEDKRKSIAKKGRDQVMANHTWETRVDELLGVMPGFINKIATQKIS